MKPIVSFEEFTFQYKSVAEPTLQDITFHIYPGEKVLIAGRSGSGKSTLAHCINGLIPFSYEGTSTGNLSVCGIDPRHTSIFELSQHVGTILQDQDSQFIGLTVEEDVAFAMENDCTGQVEMKQIVQRSLEEVDMIKFHSHSPHDLSGGQKQSVSLAGVLATNAEILLFDEPLANLDPVSSEKAIQLMKKIHRQTNKTIIIIEHRIEEILDLGLDKIIILENGRIIAIEAPLELLQKNVLQKAGLREPVYVEALKTLEYPLSNEEVYPIENVNSHTLHETLSKWMLQNPIHTAIFEKECLCKIENISFAYLNRNFALKDISMSIYKGEILALLGNNGAGKSTLAHIMTGMKKTHQGKILLEGTDMTRWSIRKRGEVVAYVMQNLNHMITQATVWEEAAFALKLKNASEEIHKKVEHALQICGLYPFRNWPVQALSYGQKKRLTIASILVTSPKLIILDEPTAGQDYFHYKEFMMFIQKLAKRGISFLLITHDMNLAIEYANRAIVLHNGEVIADNAVTTVLANECILKRANLRVSSLTRLAKHGNMPIPQQFVQSYMEARRRKRS
ncbi:ABC transporter ATP-binding protein [Bacillus sp. NPDC077411]|uniref:ABC transporter ATP-binding protein n=1 Tax=Bacillus sp. NPDC077411 TaxID=3363947 RepID=UPI0037CBAE0D